ncbi:o-succinylbenzoate synthase [Endozoicomonas sp. SCSIO W0465]|uniref:o-succinylbenzoate synthase n=1 Tax=Endozoicomonas sp. SCSIO W0465 TaxID=2918516 RepID=UPI002075E4DC|nr:o-succinylbenzoate synthase [Endozoicomonas sp. SCSIO W0465]USE34444.1 o-succinylbenzoate synthase [Endozoicomonas sp. SCSIO W0465]
MKECKADILRYRLPLKQPLLLKHSLLNEREGLVLRLRSGDRYGYGEVAPLPGFSRESLSEAEEQLQVFCRAFNDRSVKPLSFNDLENCAFLSDGLPLLSMPSVIFGIESALWWLEQNHWFAPPEIGPLLQGTTEQILHRLEQWQGHWPKEFKLKIGRDSIEDDCVRISNVLQTLPKSVNIKLDANQQWTLDQAIRVAASIDVERITFVEEPTAHVAEFSELYEQTGLRFALDETVQNPEYLLRPMQGLAAVVIKLTLVGGLARCRHLLTTAKSLGVRTVFSSSYESAIGLHILGQLSAQWTPEEPPGLDTSAVFIDSLTSDMIISGQPVSINHAFVRSGEAELERSMEESR